MRNVATTGAGLAGFAPLTDRHLAGHTQRRGQPQLFPVGWEECPQNRRRTLRADKHYSCSSCDSRHRVSSSQETCGPAASHRYPSVMGSLKGGPPPPAARRSTSKGVQTEGSSVLVRTLRTSTAVIRRGGCT